MEERVTDRFTVEAEDGQTFMVEEITRYVSAAHRDNPTAVVPVVPKRLRTSSGMNVNFKGDGVYEIVELGIVARRASEE
jgi:hypothetical protein